MSSSQSQSPVLDIMGALVLNHLRFQGHFAILWGTG